MKYFFRIVSSILSILLILSPVAHSAQLSRLHDDTITNGSIINANDLNDEFNALLNESNSQDLRLNSQEVLNKGVRTSDPVSPANGELWYNSTSNIFKAKVNGNIRKILDVSSTGILNFSQTLDPSSPINGDFWYNGTSNELKAQISGTTRNLLTTGAIAGYKFVGGPAPDYSTANTITLPSGLAAMDDTGAVTISVPSNLTLSLATNGANGLDTGTEAANTWYYVWLIRKSSDGSVASLFSTSTISPIMPSGYDQKRRLPVAVRNDASSNIMPYWISEGWPYRPKLIYNTNIGDRLNIGNNNILNNGSATTFTTIALNSLVPVTARIVILKGDFTYTASQGSLRLREKGHTHEGYQIFTNNSTSNVLYETIIGCNSSQEIEYRSSAASTSSYLWLVGFVITDI